MQDKPKIRVSQSVEGFKERAMDTWGIDEWLGWDDPNQNVVFFGLYTKNDYDTFLRHQGKKTIFWCGSDILNLVRNYESRRILKLFPETDHWCENELEAENLKRAEVEAKVCPSFLDNINNYPVSYKHSKTPHIFLCGHDQREEEYGGGIVKAIASRVPYATFHIYGIDHNSPYYDLVSPHESFGDTILTDITNVKIDKENPNIWVHGRVPEGQFNNEIMNYQCGLRPNEHDGFSEVTSKSILMGQYPITKIPYDKIWNYKTEDELVALIDKLRYAIIPNLEGRSYYLQTLNQYPWCPRKYGK
jgi:hypothetical protein